MTRFRAALVTGIVALSGTVVVTQGATPAGADLAYGVRAASAYANAHHMDVGIAVIDTTTGALYAAGSWQRRYPTASVAKTLIATRLLLAHKMHGHNETLARVMIEGSDNAAAYALYPAVGGDSVLPWLARHYRITGFGARPTQPGHWGSTQVTAVGMARFYAAIRHDRTVWPWLSKAMHAHRRNSTAGEPNDFGIAAAAPKSAVKNGWVLGRDVHALNKAVINTTGFVDHDRYAVAVIGEGAGSLYYRGGERIISEVARRLMPRGHITPAAPPAVAGLSAHIGPIAGATRMLVSGTGFDHVTTVLFGALRARVVSVRSGRSITVQTPRHAAGAVAVRVVGRYGISTARTAAVYTYVAPPSVASLAVITGSALGATRVTVHGANLRGVRAVLFGGVPGTAVTTVSDRVLMVTTPAHPAGSVRVVVRTAYGTSAGGPSFTYVEPPPEPGG